MGKRFADTQLWEQSWFLDLSPEHKAVWNYLTLNCDNAGVWNIDIPQMKKKTGCTGFILALFMAEVNRDYDKFSGEPVTVNRLMFISGDTKLWMTGFISEQNEKGNNGINSAIPAIKGILNRLRDLGLLEYALKEGFVRVQGTTTTTPGVANPCQGLAGAKDKDSSSSINLKEEGDARGRKKTEPAAEAFVEKDYFSEIWGRKPGSPEELRFTLKLIEQYGADEVKFAFREAAKQNNFKLSYTGGICKRRREKEAKAKELERARQMREENEKLIVMQKAKGVQLHLIEQVYGKDSPYRKEKVS